MGKPFLSLVAFFVFAAFAPALTWAQFTISIPNLPKIKKPKPNTDSGQSNSSNNSNSGNNTTSGNNSQNSNSNAAKGCDQYSFVYGVFLDDIKKKQEEAAAYTSPQDKIYYVSETQDD